MGGNLNAPEDATAALDTQGFATVVWYGSNSAYQSARYSPVASAWSSPLNISPTLFAPGGAYPAPLTVDVAGNVVAILNVSETGSLNVLYATIYSATKGSWGDLVAIDPAVGGLVPQDVSASSAVDASGTVTAVWQQMVEPSTTVEFYIQSNRLN
jgi:hypothetical protein